MELEPPEAAVEDSGCTFGRCFCCWVSRCSSRIPPVAPGRDYDRTPLGADHRAAWSLLIGYLSPSSAGTSLIRLRRFRVARSGRVLGRSDDALEILNDVDYDAKGKLVQISAAAATPSADGRSLALCLFCLDFNVHGAGGEASTPPPHPVPWSFFWSSMLPTRGSAYILRLTFRRSPSCRSAPSRPLANSGR
ncbi:hypothetical protein C2845_PM10G18220 [Panicum miliaceum]|uniref:Uncharacterized protein n=1 Tax=Panicum miliaceum TaxID=4540 RepID=A0A3L6PE52_PANMI|nr:hypothetical protein C2845_PM10G18220 [Panicum miliaceum]